MNTKELQNRDIFTKVGEFAAHHTTDFPATGFAATLFAELAGITRKLDAQAAAEFSHSGGGRLKQAVKEDSRDLLENRLRAIARTARAIAVITPNFSRNFSLPAHPTDRELIDLARSFADAAAPYADEFVKFSMPTDFLDQLAAETASFAEALSEKRLVRTAKSESVNAIDTGIERGLNIVRQLDAIVRNTFHDDATIMEWKRALRPERTRTSRAAESPKPAATPALAIST